MRTLHFLFTWTTLLILFQPHHDITCEQAIFPHNMYAASPTTLYHRNKSKAETEQNFIMPLRIKPFFFLSNDLLESEKAALRNVLMKAISKISKILSVFALDQPLLLPRKACLARVMSGTNEGKCSRIKKDYSGERCLDHFKIPHSHLEGFAIYNGTHLDPVKIYESDGPGVANTDFVLYITSVNSQLCNPYKSSALAYAASCKNDESGRPIAGQVNFCPRIVKTQKFDAALTYMTALHELFHALGFSRKLFDKFLECDKERNCRPRSHKFLHPFEGIMRLVTPAVVREMKNHFGCETDIDFGGPLVDMNDKASSHWDPLLMHGSLMTSKEQKPYLTQIDRISLAVFEDTGWYKVNYSQADNYTWGKGQGCKFGFKSECKYQPGFCTDNTTGCHYMRLTKARCNTKPSPFSDCGIFAADQVSCFMESNTSLLMPDEIISPASRCFISSLTDPMQTKGGLQSLKTGRCYERKCVDNNIFVRVKNGNWILCLPGSYIQVEHFQGHIECPTYEEVCNDFHVDRLEPIETSPVTQPELAGIETTPETPGAIGQTMLSAEIHLISSSPQNKSLLANLQASLMKNTSRKYGWKTSKIEIWPRRIRNQFHTHLCLFINSNSKEPIDRSTVRKFLSASVLGIFKADIRHQMIINVNNDNLIACPSSSFEEGTENTKENSAIPTVAVPLAAAVVLLAAIIETFCWINEFILL